MEDIAFKMLERRKERLRSSIEDISVQFEQEKLLITDAQRAVVQLKDLVAKLDSEIKHIIISSKDKTKTSVVDSAVEVQLRGEDLISNLEVAIVNEQMKLNNVQTNDTSNKDQAITRLPKLTLLTFNGDKLKWSEFWDRFHSSIHVKTMADADKLSYLVSSLEGTALEAVAGLAITNKNYSIAVETLKSRFGSNAILIDAHYTALTNLPKAEYNAQACRYTLDLIEKHLRILESLGENTDGNHFRATILSKFPETIIHQYYLNNKTEDSTMRTIRNCLEGIIVALERSQEASTFHIPGTSGTEAAATITTEALQVKTQKISRPERKQEQSKTFKRKKFSSGPPAKRARFSCLFCGLKNHNSADCKKFVTVEARTKKLNGRCNNCLGRNHKTNECTKKITCFRCGGGHMKMLCPKPMGEFVKNDHLHRTMCHMAKNYPITFLQTAVIQVRNPNNKKPIKCRVVLDSGSQRSYITAKKASTLELSSLNDDLLLVYTFGASEPKEMLCPSTEIIIETKRGIKKPIRVNIVPHITERLPIVKFCCEETDLPADDDSAGEAVDLLIGNDYYAGFMRNSKKKIDENLYVVDSDFGWILSGSGTHDIITSENILTVTTYCHCHNADCPYFTEPDLPLRTIDIKFLWSLESIGISDPPRATRQEEAIRHFNETIQYHDGRYEATWPWISYPPELPINFGLAQGRLRSLIKRSDAETLEEYDSILREQLQNNIIEVVEPHNPNLKHPVHYLPHHMVKQVGKRGRIVYDASAKTTGKKSLNECLYSGPSMLEDLTALLLKFRTKSVGIVADVEKAFLQVGLQESDRDVTRFLWLKDVTKELTDDNLLYLRFRRVPFGIISSPFLLTATIRYHMSQTNSELLKAIANNCYVDNLVTGADSTHEARQIYEKTRDTFDQLSMNIRDWLSNDKDFLQSVPPENQEKKSEIVKLLGLSWNVEKDTLKLKVTEDHFNTDTPADTKRKVLRTLARVYDPCGFVCPLILPLKLLFRDICERKLKWDAILPSDLTQTLKQILEDMKTVTEVELPRYIGNKNSNSDTMFELHCFSDASKNAYAAVIYLIARSLHATSVSLMMGKSRLAKTDDNSELKIPKLELLGFLIASRLLKYVRTVLELPIQKEILWTDSLVVLGWMRSNKLLPPFVSNRVEEIKRNQGQAELCYINTKSNPADVATRPDTWLQNKELWLSGPAFLKSNETDWPDDRHYDAHKTLFSAGEVLDHGPGNQHDHSPGGQDVIETEDLPEDLPDMEIDEPEVVESNNSKDNSSDCTTSEIKKLQTKYFTDELAGKTTHLTKNLGLFKDVDGILRCRGRMANTTWSYDMKYPILLPRDSERTWKIIKDIHERNYHVGASHTLSLIREKYWIPQGRAQVQKVIKNCPQCIKHGGGPYRLPSTPALPTERVNYNTPFSFTGIDYFGPMYVSTSTGKEKRWIALFTCLTVRAIHLEVVKDITAEECLLAIRRFAAARNVPKRFYSDNATYFTLTSEVMTKPYCIQNGIDWKFIPQLAPWHGGFYERLVAIVKHCLKRTLEKHLLNDSKLATVIKEVEAVVNTRPLTKVGTEVTHVLRPADFLSLGKCLFITPANVDVPCAGTATKLDLIESWKRGMKILEEFKKMFIGQYLLSLRERYQHSPKQPRVKSFSTPNVGDVVQIKADSKNRENWKVGRITDLIKGADGEHRVAKIKVNDNTFTRSIGHLYPLEVDCLEPKTGQNLETDIMPSDAPVRYFDANDFTELEKLHESSNEDDGIKSADEISVTPAAVENVGNENEVLETVDDETPRTEEATPTVENAQHETKSRRHAAIRAREKILEWTRHLLTLLQ